MNVRIPAAYLILDTRRVLVFGDGSSRSTAPFRQTERSRYGYIRYDYDIATACLEIQRRGIRRIVTHGGSRTDFVTLKGSEDD